MQLSSAPCVQALEHRRLLAADAGIDGFGVLGDSYSDEYQFNAPISLAQGWVEQLGEDSNAHFGAWSETDPAGPASAGYEFNWALDGGTSSSMIAGGHHLGLAQQAAAGDVDLATIFIGGNDFRAVFGVLAAAGPAAAQAALMAAVPTAAQNIAIATGTLLGASHDVNVVLTTLPKLSYLPQVRLAVAATPELAPFVAAVDGAVQILNQQIVHIAAGSDRVIVADFAEMVDGWFSAKKFKVGNVEMNREALFNPTNDPSHLTLADGFHPGTIVQGLLANLYVDTANAAFGTNLKPLTSNEILQNAGLKFDPAAGPGSARAFFSDGGLIGDLFDGVDDESVLPA